jgi:hypothetical protein
MAPGHPSHPHSTTNLANSLLLEWATKSNNPNNNNNNICSSNLLAVTKFKEFGVCFALIFAVLKKYPVSPIQGPTEEVSHIPTKLKISIPSAFQS